MAKGKKSACELADMVAARMIIRPESVSIYKDASYGWAVNVFSGPSQLFGDQVMAEQIAPELRERYDLKE